jgi:MSHA biogenesis protein MshI
MTAALATDSASTGFSLAGLLARFAREPAAQVGLQWQDEHLALARIEREDDGLRLARLQRFEAPQAARVALLKRLQREGLLRGAAIHLLLSAGDYELQQLAAPSVPDDELHEALRWQLRGALSYPPEEALIDSLRIPDPEGAPARNQLLAVSCQRHKVGSATAAFVAAGVPLASVDVPEFAQRNLTRFVSQGVRGTQAWLSFDADTCLFTVNHDADLVFARRMLMPAATGGAEDPREQVAERVVVQVQRSLDLFERGSHLPQVGHIAVGPHAAAASIAARLADRSAVRCTVVDRLNGFVGGEPTRLPHDLAAVLGCAMRDLAEAW